MLYMCIFIGLSTLIKKWCIMRHLRSGQKTFLPGKSWKQGHNWPLIKTPCCSFPSSALLFLAWLTFNHYFAIHSYSAFSINKILAYNTMIMWCRWFEDCPTVHPVRYNLWIVQTIWGLLCKARIWTLWRTIQGLSWWFTDKPRIVHGF